MDRNTQLIEKIIVHAEKIIDYCNGFSMETFIADGKTAEACVFNLTQIGELTRLFDDDYLSEHNNIPWHKMRGLRNRIVHNYEGIDLRLIWDIINEDLENLIKQLKEMLM